MQHLHYQILLLLPCCQLHVQAIVTVLLLLLLRVLRLHCVLLLQASLQAVHYDC
jgi:hypothetical protein